LMNLIAMLLLVQMPWILVWWSCDVCCLAMIFLGIYWIIFELMWIGSFCLLLWAFNLHALPYVHCEMKLIDAIDMGPLGLCSWLV
jgi:hypothetical protein